MASHDPARGSLALAIAHAVKRALDGDSQRPSDRPGKRARCEPEPIDVRQRRVMARRLAIAHDQAARVALFLARRRTEAMAGDHEATPSGANAIVCTICLGGLHQDAEETEALACGHVYHRRCLARWLGYNRCCPIDRRPLE